MTVIEERLPMLQTVRLEAGSHAPGGLYCAMELVAYIAGEPWSATPKCVSPVITAFLVNWNDSLDDEDRQMLKPLIPLVIGTRTTAKDETTRSWIATDWLARECAPAFLRCAGLTAQAELLEALAPLTAASARKAQPTLDKAQADSAAAGDAAWAAAWDAAWAAAGDAAGAAAWDAAWAAAWDAVWAAAGDAAWAAAWAAARDAAWAAARDAAWAAARDAARAAARDAARAAAWAAARAAAGAAAGDAAGAALAPTVKILQASAYQLVVKMAEVGRS